MSPNSTAPATYTDIETHALLESEGFAKDEVAAVFDSMVLAGFELDQPDEGYILTADEVDLLREQLSHEAVTLTFPNRFAKLLAKGAIKRDAERQDTFRQVVEIVGPDAREHINRVITLDDDTHVFEITSGQESPLYGVVHKGFDSWRFYSLDEALLLAVELRNGGGPNSHGHIYAARALGVKPTVDY